jgi:hypothetical protein
MEKEFVDGMLIKAPRDNAPEFVKCAISIKRSELGNWLRAKQDEWINLDIKVGKSGKWYAEVNNWKPEQPAVEKGTPFNDAIPDNSDIPF